MTPLEAAEIEVRAELAALARRLGTGHTLTRLRIEIEFDQKTHMPRAVEVEEQRRRHILGGTLPTQVKRSTSAA